MLLGLYGIDIPSTVVLLYNRDMYKRYKIYGEREMLQMCKMLVQNTSSGLPSNATSISPSS